MIPLLIIGGLGLGAFAIAKAVSGNPLTNAQAQARSSGPTPGVIPPQPLGANPYAPGGGNTSAIVGMGGQVGTAGLSAASGGGLVSASTAATAIPIVGAVAAIGGGILAAISAHHKQAVAAEAASLNAAVPHYQQSLTLIIQAVNAKQLPASGAGQYIDMAVSDYYQMVASIIKGRWPRTSLADEGTPGTPPATCNGPCVVGHWWVEGWALKLKNRLAAGSGTVVFDAIPPHAGFNGMGSWSANIVV